LTSFWTPTAADAAWAEQRLATYLRTAAKDPLAVSPPIALRPDHPPHNLRELGDLVQNLAEYRRQYVGLEYGADRQIEIVGFPASAGHNWRERVVMVVDGGCGYWHVNLAVRKRQIVRFWCQPSP
jgi:hypothetical protein